MDWSNPMAVFGFADEPQTNDGQVDDETDDIYDHQQPREDAAHPGAPHSSDLGQNIHINTPQPISQEERKINQKKAEMLRAKLLAQRQNTPTKAASRSGTPVQVRPQTVPSQPPAVPPSTRPPQPQTNNTVKEEVKQKPEVSTNIGSLEALLDEGKALADAKTAALAASVTTPSVINENGISRSMIAPEQNAETRHKPTNTNAAQEPSHGTHEHPKHPINLSDSYYTDLPAWLEMTGFHDVEFRESKLSTYKERKALEAEAARIAERLEKLKQAEQEAMQSLRMATPKPSAIAMPPPPLPATMPTEVATPKVNGVNGVKRPRSPATLPPEKMRRREDSSGFRIRGANDSPLDARPPPPLGRPRTPSPADLERRITYPDARRSSYQPRGSRVESRDSSLERRQSYYRQDGEPTYYDSYTPRDPPRPALDNTRRNSIVRSTQYRGSVPLDLRKGGQSPFRRVQ